MFNICRLHELYKPWNIRSLVLTWRELVIRIECLCNSVFLDLGHLAFRWMSLVQMGWQQQPSPFPLPFAPSSVPLSVPFISFLPTPTPHVSIPFIFPACTLSVCFLSTRLFVCQSVSQTGIPEQRAAAASVLFALPHPSVRPSVAGLCPF